MQLVFDYDAEVARPTVRKDVSVFLFSEFKYTAPVRYALPCSVRRTQISKKVTVKIVVCGLSKCCPAAMRWFSTNGVTGLALFPDQGLCFVCFE